MTDADSGEEATLFPKTAGERLREARESQGLSLAEVAARTRVPQRHLEAIEMSNYAGLPSPTYSVGFAKAYARAIGMDEVSIGREVRGQTDRIQRPPEYQPYDLQDPKRLPPPGLAMGGIVVAVLVLIAVGLWFGTGWFSGEAGPVASTPPVATQPVPAAQPVDAPPPAPSSSGQVTLTATDIVWLRIYDADGNSLYEAEMKPGDRYDVPGDAKGPMINIGRPDKLQILVNGSMVPALGDGSRAIKDVGISAAALLARGMPLAAPSPAASNGAGEEASARTSARPPRAQSTARRTQPGRRSTDDPARADQPPPSAAPSPTPATPAAQPPAGTTN